MAVFTPKTLAQQDFLDLFDRILPQSYLDPLKNEGPGYELLQMFAKVMERASTAVGNFERDSFIVFSSGGVKATGNVELFRATSTAGAVTVKQGTVLRTSGELLEFVTVADAVFGSSDLGPVTVAVQSVAADTSFNVPGQVITAAGVVLAGEIDTVKTPLQDPAFGDASIEVRQIVDMTGALCAYLDQHGLDRGLARRAGESDSLYQKRIRTLPDTVSRDAILRALAAILTTQNITFDFIETFEITYQTCWDGPAAAIAGSDYDPNLFVYDDPRSATPFRNRWISEEDYRGAFIVVVEPLVSMNDVGQAYDDTAITVADHATTLGRRSQSAYDIPAVVDADLILAGAYDGFDIGHSTMFLELLVMLQEMKAAGVAAIVEKQGQ